MSVFLGIELGSTRIKAVAIDKAGKPLASGGYDWENRFEGGVWTYPLDDAWHGLRESFRKLADDYKEKNGQPLTEISAIGISAMMHGYLVFDKNDRQLAEFRTWRNTMTEKSSELLTETFGFNIPQRWSIAHLHHAMSGGEAHVSDISSLTTLAGYIHYKLTGNKVVGIGEASGMFPIDSDTNDYHEGMLKQFDGLAGKYKVPWKLRDILPQVRMAGENAGCLTPDGAKLLDPSGIIKPGTLVCPPEGDAGTGMVATNAVTPQTGNISAGTSVFAMIVLEKALKKLHPQIDVITTPTGKPVAMVHCNNCTSDLDAWISLFSEVLTLTNRHCGLDPQSPKDSDNPATPFSKAALYAALYNAALGGDKDCGGLVSVNYLSGEHITGFSEGRPMFIRTSESKFTAQNFMRSLLLSAMTTLKIGMDILIEDEAVTVHKLLGHGGLFKTPGVAQKLMASALQTPVAVMESAGEGGAWGIALLAAYCAMKEQNETLEDFLDKKIFAGYPVSVIEPDPEDTKGFKQYLEQYKKALEVERTAIEAVR